MNRSSLVWRSWTLSYSRSIRPSCSRRVWLRPSIRASRGVTCTCGGISASSRVTLPTIDGRTLCLLDFAFIVAIFLLFLPFPFSSFLALTFSLAVLAFKVHFPKTSVEVSVLVVRIARATALVVALTVVSVFSVMIAVALIIVPAPVLLISVAVLLIPIAVLLISASVPVLSVLSVFIFATATLTFIPVTITITV